MYKVALSESYFPAQNDAEIRDVRLSPMQDYNAPGWLILTAEAYAVHEPWLKSRFNDYGELMRYRLAFGALLEAGRLGFSVPADISIA